MANQSKVEKSTYHHGDLRKSLIATAIDIINHSGFDALSLRKLAEKVGVSRTAAYHHFNDKNDLLCAVATQGFVSLQQQSELIFNNSALSYEQKYRQFVYSYVGFATDNPALYELMFGRTIWKSNNSTDGLRSVAYSSFNYQVEMMKLWQSKGIMPSGESPLRLAQVSWGTLHGIAKLKIDGIYEHATSIEDMCDCAINLFLSQAKLAE